MRFTTSSNMANSYIDYCGRSARVNDQILTIIVGFIADIARKESGVDQKTVNLVDSWHFETLHSGPGLISLDMSGFWETAVGAKVLQHLLDQCEKRLLSFGDVIPGESLGQLNKSGQIDFVDTRVDVVLPELQKLRLLTTG